MVQGELDGEASSRGPANDGNGGELVAVAGVGSGGASFPGVGRSGRGVVRELVDGVEEYVRALCADDALHLLDAELPRARPAPALGGLFSAPGLLGAEA